MKPFYEHDNVTIYHGDTLEVMTYLIKQGVVRVTDRLLDCYTHDWEIRIKSVCSPQAWGWAVKGWLVEIEDTRFTISYEVKGIFGDAPKATRKESAEWIIQHYKHFAAYLFAMFDGKDIDTMIYKIAFTERNKEN